ncbi:anaerobic dimethylsulfoxide reductase, A subunit [Treponema primitia ZAS-2]|uniref:Anaerobic dimethylsulfoxide reductase, A subunit n=1 Tax=Treponema primitia (strain ATCC BAA-887 / DSM 12427 / ZAS-2) TaxID=545694 RepID=F5YI43_TREPZ|nr:DMSO/selenate family reductase complex A subunit [Treponema primitia]AEF83834.1 anaerobic dimethylsulfoxide reductase, A subunit [Treponema primitia ZAS-2]
MRYRAEVFRMAAELLLFSQDQQAYSFNKRRLESYRDRAHHRQLLSFLEDISGLGPGAWENYREEYGYIVENTRGYDIPLWESSFRSPGQTLLDKNTLAVQECYAAWGLELRPELHQVCDHIGVEFAFCACLAGSGLREAEEYCGEFLSRHTVFLLRNIVETLDSLERADGERFKVTELFRAMTEFLSGIGVIEKESGIGVEIEAPSGERIASLRSYSDKFAALFFREAVKSLPFPERLIPSSGNNNCGSRCRFLARTRAGNILGFRFDSERTPFIKYCIRGHHYHETFLSHRRIRYPMKRIGERGEGKFRRISWEEAIDAITGEWKRIRDEYGPASRYVMPGSGAEGTANPENLAKRLLALDGGYLGHYNFYSTACTAIATPYVYGTNFTGSSSHFLGSSKLIILWGHNPKESGFGAYLTDDLVRAKKQGIPVVAVDPRHNETIKLLDGEWIPIRPGTDGALADAMAYVILSEKLEDREFMDRYCLGFDEAHLPPGTAAGESYESYLFGKQDGLEKTPEWAERIIGIPQALITGLARRYALSKPAALIAGYGMQRHSNGEQGVRALAMLSCLTGNVGVEGGGAVGTGHIPGFHIPSFPLPVNPCGVSIPSFLWTDAVSRGREMSARQDHIRGRDFLESPIKMILNLAGNTLINQHSDINATVEILRDTEKCEFIVVSDLFLTPSARFADILLPGTSFLESPNIARPWREGDYLLYCNPAVKPLFESRFEYDWLTEIAERLGLYDEFTEGHTRAEGWLESLYEECRNYEEELPPFAEFAKEGGYFYKQKTNFIAFREQREDFERNPFPTPSGKIEIFSKRLQDFHDPAIPALPRYIPGFEGPEDHLTAEYPFQLTGWHTKRRTHSIHDNNILMDRVESPAVYISPEDAEKLHIEDNALVEVWNSRGTIRIRAAVRDGIMKGVLAMSQGAWFTPAADGADIRGNINAITTLAPSPLAKGNPQHSNLVNIRGL